MDAGEAHPGLAFRVGAGSQEGVQLGRVKLKVWQATRVRGETEGPHRYRAQGGSGREHAGRASDQHRACGGKRGRSAEWPVQPSGQFQGRGRLA